jgi:hypothetical protein
MTRPRIPLSLTQVLRRQGFYNAFTLTPCLHIAITQTERWGVNTSSRRLGGRSGRWRNQGKRGCCSSARQQLPQPICGGSVQLGGRQDGAALEGVIERAGFGAGVNNVGPMALAAISALEAPGVRAPGAFARLPAQVTADDLEPAGRVVALREAEHLPVLQERSSAYGHFVAIPRYI